MKFALSFIVLAISFVWIASPWEPSWRWIFFWPAANLLVASFFYMINSPACFGKKKTGALRILNYLFFLPYVVGLWWVWFLFAKHARENPFDMVNKQLWIGRRLDEREAAQSDFENIIDLTAEFTEVPAFRERNYIPLYMLDGAVPDAHALKKLVAKFSQLTGKSLVHCAQGHGRTGLVAVAILLETNPQLDLDSALEILKRARPGVHCNKRQVRFLRDYFQKYFADRQHQSPDLPKQD